MTEPTPEWTSIAFAERPAPEPPATEPPPVIPADPSAGASTAETHAGGSAPPADEGARRRLGRRVRRRQAAALREASFDWLADGFTHREIAAARKVSVAVVRRDVARAIRARQAETREGHAQLQIARLTKGLTLVAHRIGAGDMSAVGPLVKLVTALDRYQGAAPAARLPAPAPSALAALAAPPLALTHAATPLAISSVAESMEAEPAAVASVETDNDCGGAPNFQPSSNPLESLNRSTENLLFCSITR
jgi:hypothetical protein